MGDEKCWQTMTLIMNLLNQTIYIYMQILNSLCSKLSEQIQNRGKLNKHMYWDGFDKVKHMYGYTFQRTGAQCYLAGPVPLLEKNQPHISFHRTIIYHSSTSIYWKLMNRWLCTISNPHMFPTLQLPLTSPLSPTVILPLIPWHSVTFLTNFA